MKCRKHGMHRIRTYQYPDLLTCVSLDPVIDDQELPFKDLPKDIKERIEKFGSECSCKDNK